MKNTKYDSLNLDPMRETLRYCNYFVVKVFAQSIFSTLQLLFGINDYKYNSHLVLLTFVSA
jgi:hypothetical protein